MSRGAFSVKPSHAFTSPTAQLGGGAARDSGSDSSSDFGDSSSCDSCDSAHLSFAQAQENERRGTIVAHNYLSRRATMKLKDKAKQVQNAIAAVLSAEKLSRQSASPTAASAPSATAHYVPAVSNAAFSTMTETAMSDSMATDVVPSIGTALARPRNATPPATNASASPPIGSRRGSFRRSSLRSTASIDPSVSSDDEAAAAQDEEALEAAKPSEIQISVASVLKKGARTKDAVATEILMKSMKKRQPILPLNELPPLHATLKPYLEAGSGKNVTQFGAAALAIVFVVRMMHRAATKTVHQQNTERFDVIAALRQKKNNCLTKKIHGASTRSMHLHIQKQRAGLRNIMTFAVRESNLRTRDARIGKAGSHRGELLKHTEDQLFDRSEYQRGEIGSRGNGTVQTSSDYIDQSLSGGFASANFESVAAHGNTNNTSNRDLGQFLFDDQGHAPTGSAHGASGELHNKSDHRAATPSTATLRGASRATKQQHGAAGASVLTPVNRVHRPLETNVCDPHVFTLHHLWKDEPFRDPYVETDKVYQYASQIEASELFAFTRTTLPNLHLEVMRLKQQLDPTPWEGTAADKRLRDNVASRAASRKDRLNATVPSIKPPESARLPQSFLPALVRPNDAPGTAQTARSSAHPLRTTESFASVSGEGAAHLLPTLSLPSARDISGKPTPSLTARGASLSPRNLSGFPGTSSQPSTRITPAQPPSAPPPSAPPPSAPPLPLAATAHPPPGLALPPPPGTPHRAAQVDEDTKAQRRGELAMLESIMEEEHRIAIETFQSFLLHKDMEHSVFASKSIEELRRLVQSNDLIFPMKRYEMLQNKKPAANIAVTAEDLAKKKVSAVTNYDVFKQLHVAEASVKLQVKQHQEQQSIAYTTRWFQTLKTNVERHSMGLSPLARTIFDAFEPLFKERITGKHGFYAVMSTLEVVDLQQAEGQFLLMRLAVPFRVSQAEVQDALRARGATFVLLDKAYYQKLKDSIELDERRRIREHNLAQIDSVTRINSLMDNAFAKAATIVPTPPRLESKVFATPRRFDSHYQGSPVNPAVL